MTKLKYCLARSAIRPTCKYTCAGPPPYTREQMKNFGNIKLVEFHNAGVPAQKNAMFKVSGQDSAKEEQEQFLPHLRQCMVDTSECV